MDFDFRFKLVTAVTALIAVASLSLATATTVSASPAEWKPDSPYRVFYSDDSDPKARPNASGDNFHFPVSLLGNLTLPGNSSLPRNDSDAVNRIAKEFDIYFHNATPQLPGLNDSYSRYRDGRVLDPTSRHTSRWPAGTDTRDRAFTDSRAASTAEIHVRDYYSNVRGFESGVLHPYRSECNVLVSGLDACNRHHMIPSSGELYLASDYRLVLPYEEDSPPRKEVAKKETCYRGGGRRYLCEKVWHIYSYRLNDHQVNHTLRIGDREFSSTDNTVEYSGLNQPHYSDIKVYTDFTFNVTRITQKRIKRCHPEGRLGLDCERETDSEKKQIQKEIEVEETVGEASVPSNQEMTVSQTVYGDRKIRIEFDAPPEFYERRTWSKLKLGDGESQIVNTWGYYAKNHTTNPKGDGGTAANSGELQSRSPKPEREKERDRGVDESGFSYPNIPVMAMGPRNPNVTILVDRNDVGERWSEPRIVNSTVVRKYPEIDNGDNVNLSNGEPRIHGSITVTNPPGEVTRAEDVFGDPIPLNTTRYDAKDTDLNIQVTDSRNRVKITLTTDDGGPVSGEIEVSGARKSIYTVTDGVVYADRESSFVKAVFDGEINEAKQTVYRDSTDSIKLSDGFGIMTQVWGTVSKTKHAGFFLVMFFIFAALRQ